MSFRDQLVKSILAALEPAIESAVNTALGVGGPASAPASAPKRGRPAGSKNRAKAIRGVKGGKAWTSGRGRPAAWALEAVGTKSAKSLPLMGYPVGTAFEMLADGTVTANGKIVKEANAAASPSPFDVKAAPKPAGRTVVRIHGMRKKAPKAK